MFAVDREAATNPLSNALQIFLGDSCKGIPSELKRALLFFVVLLETRVAFGLGSVANICSSDILVISCDSLVILPEGADEFDILDGISDGIFTTSPEVVEIGPDASEWIAVGRVTGLGL